jgi:hypothetical protein
MICKSHLPFVPQAPGSISSNALKQIGIVRVYAILEVPHCKVRFSKPPNLKKDRGRATRGAVLDPHPRESG